MPAIAYNLAAVHGLILAACARSGRDPAAIRLIAVTKAQDTAVLAPLAAAGVHDYGENRLEHHALMHAAAGAGAHFHAIGRLQGRQLGEIARLSDTVHGLCEERHLRRLADSAAAAGRALEVFLQVNTSGEASKAGIAGAALPSLIAAARSHQPHLRLVGLMTMAPLGATPEAAGPIRGCFRRCRELARDHGLERLSMGMSGDFEIAVEEGATDLRIGSRLFA